MSEPYRKGLSPLASQHRKPTFTSDAVRIASALNRAGINYQLEHEIVRYGEYRNGHPLSYVLDILVMDERYRSVAIEVEGRGSASRFNDKRDQYLSTLGISVLHVDNSVEGDEVVIRLNASFRSQA